MGSQPAWAFHLMALGFRVRDAHQPRQPFLDEAGLKPGDTVLVHAGFAIEKLSPEDSDELKALWDELRALAGDPYAH
jgi:hypothetical protein